MVRGALMLFVRKQQVQAFGLLRYSRVVSGNATPHFIAEVAEMGGLTLTSS